MCAQGKKLASELAGTIDRVFGEEENIVNPPQHLGAPLTRASGQKLAAALIQGERYAFLPNHGLQPRYATPRVVIPCLSALFPFSLSTPHPPPLAAHSWLLPTLALTPYTELLAW